MKRRVMWLSRQRDGNFMFTYLKPELHKIFGSRESDFYVPAGEPIGLRYWCPAGVKAFFGVELPIGGQVQVWVSGGEVK